jgi:prephenate dehydratase
MRLGYLGPAGTFTHEALLASARAGAASSPGATPLATPGATPHAIPDTVSSPGATPHAIPFATERETILAVEAGDVDAGLVPIENSLEGGVNATLDTLALDAPGVRIVGEEVLPISHVIAARDGLELGVVEAVVSHPQALGQCRRFLREVLPGVRAVAATSTADAMRAVSESAEPWAAIGTRSAAGLYGCAVLRERIEDEPDNETRFVWIAAGGAPEEDAPGPFKTSLVFHGSGDAAPGWLVRCLSEFAFRGINLTRIESRPRKRRLGHYLFLADLEGRDSDPRVAEAVEGLRAHCEMVRVLGSYPAAS